MSASSGSRRGGLILGLCAGVVLATAAGFLFSPKRSVCPVQTPGTPVTAVTEPLMSQADKVYYADQLRRQLELCGDLCRVGGPRETLQPGEPMATRRAPVDCDRLYATDELEAAAERWPPPAAPPGPMQAEFEWFSTKKSSLEMRAQRYSGGEAMEAQWTIGLVEGYIASLLNGTMEGNYGQPAVAQVREAARRTVANRTVLVIGSENPWVEAIALAEGASHVYVLEYGKINSTHPQITTFTPREFNELYRRKELPRIESVLTYSSLEHSGLGRYGDSLNPWGDVMQTAKVWCVLPENAPVALGIEGGIRRPDWIRWNLHREYGQGRLPYLFSNFRPFDVVGENPQVIITARKLPPV